MSDAPRTAIAGLERKQQSIPIVEARKLRKHFGHIQALNDLSVSVQPGEFFGLLGPNGAGKSTLMNCFTGYLKPDGGEVYYHGKTFTTTDPEARRLFGIAPQQIALYETLTALENLEIAGQLYGYGGRKLKQRCEELLEVVQLRDRAKDRVKGFSGGMLRRLNIAASLVHHPRILFCDEPTAGVDPQARNAIFNLLEQLNNEGITIVYTTHYMEEVERMCSRIAIVDNGKVVKEGTHAELLKSLPETRVITFPASEETVNFAGQAAPRFGEVEVIHGGGQYRLSPTEGFAASEFFRAAEEHGLPPWEFHFARGTLEDVFLHLTGRNLRE